MRFGGGGSSPEIQRIPERRPQDLKDIQLINNCNDITDFTASGPATWSNTSDVGDFLSSTAGIKAVGLEGGAPDSRLELDLGGGNEIDMTGREFGIWFKTNRHNDLADGIFRMWIEVSTAGFGTDSLTWKFMTAAGQKMPWKDDRWCRVGTQWSTNESPTGATNRALIRFIRIALRGQTPAGSTDGFIDRFFHFQQGNNNAVILTFDDMNKSDVERAAPYMSQFGFKGNTMGIYDKVGPTFGKMTQENLESLRDDYLWDLCNHGDIDSVVQTVALRKAEIIRNNLYMLRNGLNGLSYSAIPANNATKESLIVDRAFFVFNRSLGRRAGCPNPPDDWDYIRATNQGASTYSGAGFQTALDDAVTDNALLVIIVHQIVASGASGSTEMNQADFEDMIDRINAKVGANVVSISELMNTTF